MEYALEEVDLDTGRRHIVMLSWSEDIEKIRKTMRRFVELDQVNVSYGGVRHRKFRIVSRAKVDQYIIVEEES